MMNTVELVAKPISSTAWGDESPSFFRFTSEQYHKLAETGVLPPDTRFELIHGSIYQMHPVGSEHSYFVKQLYDGLTACLENNGVVYSQSAVHFADDNEPEPDVFVLRPPSQQYRARLPEPADILLIVEVSKSTLSFDRSTKLELYARAGILEYWLVNLVKMQLEVYRNPDTEEGRYRELITLEEGRAATPTAFSACEIDWWA